jgi:carboxypeptidase C (cathepsin A)
VRRALAWTALLAAIATALPAQGTADAYGIVTTHHRVVVDGKVLAYTARAGLIPIRDNEAGDVHANIFFIAYTLDGAPGAPARPLTFLWNGGPGSNSGLVHLLGFGPKRVTRTGLVDNADTWLAFTDLVFVDPVGTGYSRPLKAAYEPEFYQPRGDAESVAEFIRVYRTRYDAFAQPLYLAGESYGVTRAALVTQALERRRTRVAGAIMLSLALPLGKIADAWREASIVPSFTAAAWYNKQLAPDLPADLAGALAASESWTNATYAPALAGRDGLTNAQRDSVVAGLARFTGLSANKIDRQKLTVSMQAFGDELLARENKGVGHYDSRITGVRDTLQRIYDPRTDPSLKDILDATTVLLYLRTELGYRSDLYYAGPFGGGYPPSAQFRGDWMSVRWSRVAASDSARGAAKSSDWFAVADSLAAAWLAAALEYDHGLRVMIACGRFDLACAYFGNEHQQRQLPAAFADRVHVYTYDGGHAIYTDSIARRRLRADVARFIGAGAPGARSAAPRAAAAMTELAVTHHTITVHGRPMRYTARAGLLPIVNNDAGEVHGQEFFVSYTLDRPAGSPPRPVTFLWNGGPGANSALVHLTGFGPRRIASGDDPAHPAAKRETLDPNEETWLRATDLVFVDPIGTGFSRPAKPEYPAEFYGTSEDIASTAEFVRVYRTHFDLLKVPVYLAGESYGVWRAAGVAEQMERRGQRVAGVIMISGGVAMGPVVSGAYRAALLVPSRAATAFYHGKLAPDLQQDLAATMRQAQEWALTEYAPALGRRDSLTEAQRTRIIAQLARFSGVSADSVDRKTLVLTSPQFRTLLLSDRKQKLARYDMRLVGEGGLPDHARLVTHYLREDLRFYTDLAYQGEEDGWSSLPPDSVVDVGGRWDWDQGNPPPGPPVIDPEAPAAATSIGGTGDGPPGGAQPWLRRAMKLDPTLRAFVAAGLYDSLNGCADNDYIVAHVKPDYGRRIETHCYAAGHMMYDVAAERRRLQKDVAEFIAATSGAAR